MGTERNVEGNFEIAQTPPDCIPIHKDGLSKHNHVFRVPEPPIKKQPKKGIEKIMTYFNIL